MNKRYYKHEQESSVQNVSVQKDARIETRIPSWKKDLLVSFCNSRNMGINEFVERLIDWRLAKDGLMKYDKKDSCPDLTLEELETTREQYNILQRKTKWYQSQSQLNHR